MENIGNNTLSLDFLRSQLTEKQFARLQAAARQAGMIEAEKMMDEGSTGEAVVVSMPKLVPYQELVDEQRPTVDEETGEVELPERVAKGREGDPHIYFKLDAYCATFKDVTVKDVIKWVGLDYNLVCDDFFENNNRFNRGFETLTRFSYNGVNIEMRGFYMYDDPEEVSSVFECTFPYIKLDIMGEGLDFLRSIGIEVDKNLRDMSRNLETQRLTRMDFAFDLVNYAPDFWEQMKHHCETQNTYEQYVLRYKAMGGPMKFEIKTGSQKTLYLGSPSSDQLLRVYDKRYQNIDKRTGVYKGKNPYNSPASWIRIELQTRNKNAEKIGYSESDMISIFRYIYDYYTFADITTPAHRRQPVSWWRDLFDWKLIPEIIQNAKCVESEVVTYRKKLEKSMNDDALKFFLEGMAFGWERVAMAAREKLYKMQNWFIQDNPDYWHRQWERFQNRVIESREGRPMTDGIVVTQNSNFDICFSSQAFMEVQAIIDRDMKAYMKAIQGQV